MSVSNKIKSITKPVDLYFNLNVFESLNELNSTMIVLSELTDLFNYKITRTGLNGNYVRLIIKPITN
ncbi:MAG: hypothetical protein ACRCTA_01920 [Bacilli bacterium]